MIRRVLPMLVAAAAALTLTACGGGTGAGVAGTTAPVTTAPPTTTAVTTAAPTAATRPATVYFADADAQQLVAETRRVPVTASRLRSVLVELAKGPTSPNAIAALPPGTEIVGTNVQGGEALVNLSGEFLRGYPTGGAAAEFAVLAPLVYTATGVPGVDRVRFTVDGLTPQPVGSQYDWSGTFSRADFPGVLAASP